MAKILTAGQYFGREIMTVESDSFKYTFATYPAERRIEEHSHENSYISLLVEGAYSEESSAGAVMVQQGAVVYRPASYIHSHHLPVPTYHCFNIEFKRSWEHSAGMDFKLPCRLIIHKPGNIANAYQIFGYFLQNFPPDFLEELMLTWVAELSGDLQKYNRAPWLQKVKAILENEYDAHHTLHSIAARVFVHPVYLANAFKKRTGLTIGEYQIGVKLEMALWMLLNTRLPIHEIAFQTGFYDSPHFAHVFKKAYKISPKEFRGKLRKLIGYN